jgi:hypothetical protein
MDITEISVISFLLFADNASGKSDKIMNIYCENSFILKKMNLGICTT